MLTQSLEGFRLYPDRRRARPAPPTKPVPVPSFSDLCALCVSAFSSPNLSPFNPKLLALSAQRLEERNEGSPAEGSTFNRPSLRPVPAVDCKLSAVSLRPSFHNSHRIIFFTYPHPLTPIESYSCKKQGEGVPLTPSRRQGTSYLCVTHRNPRNPSLFICLLHNARTARGGGPLLTTHYPLLTVHPGNPYSRWRILIHVRARKARRPGNPGTRHAPLPDCYRFPRGSPRDRFRAARGNGSRHGSPRDGRFLPARCHACFGPFRRTWCQG
jgi:hypothetical protein